MRRHLPAVAIVSACLVYAVVRYIGFQGVTWSQLPLYVTNKALALAGLICLVLALVGRLARLGRVGFGLVLAHGMASLALLGPVHYGAIFRTDGSFTLAGGLALLAGILALVWSLRWSGRGWLLLGLGGVHVAALGLRGWIAPAAWPGYLPPMTLLGLAAVALGAVLLLRRRSS